MEFIKNLLKLNLQYFADDNSDNNPNGDDGGDNTPPDKTFTQSEVEELIKKRLARVKNEPPADYEELKQKLKEIEEKDLSESEKLKKKLAEKDSYVQSVEEQLNALKEKDKKEAIKNKFKEAANKVGIEYMDAAIKLADIDSFELDEEGNIVGLEDAVKKLAEENPFLLSNETKEIGGSSNPGGQDRTITKEQFMGMSYSEKVQLYDKNPGLYKQLNIK